MTNQAIQVLQGSYITNTYGNGVQCQGATMNITPYITGTGSFKRLLNTYMDPVYDVHDADDDGQIDNPVMYSTMFLQELDSKMDIIYQQVYLLHGQDL